MPRGRAGADIIPTLYGGSVDADSIPSPNIDYARIASSIGGEPEPEEVEWPDTAKLRELGFTHVGGGLGLDDDASSGEDEFHDALEFHDAQGGVNL